MAPRTQKLEIPEAKIRQVIWMRDKANKTKKACCEHLGIAYNTKRLDTIISDFQEREIRVKELKEKAKKSDFSESQIKGIIKDYVTGTAVSNIATQYYTNSARIKKILLENNVPLRGRGKKTPAKVDHVTQDLEIKFKINDKVFIPNLNAYGTIEKVFDEEYIESMQNGYSKAITLSASLPEGKEPRRGVHFEEYWVHDGIETGIKTMALQSHLSSIEQIIADTGREYYRVWRTDENKCFYDIPRAKLFPVIEV